VTTRKSYLHFVSKISSNDNYRNKWGALFVGEPLIWGEIWGRLKGLGSDHIASRIWSQLRLNFWSPFLEKHQWRNTNQNGKCNICDDYQNDQFHLIKDCETTLDLWEDIELILIPLVPVVISTKERCFGLEGKSLNFKLRNYISFSLRSAIHTCKNYPFPNKQIAKSKILDTLKSELKTDLKIKFERAMESGKTSLFVTKFLIKDILGKGTLNNLSLCDFLE
jgi:hypothetical protein